MKHASLIYTFAIACALLLPQPNAHAIQTVDLGTAANFALLAGSGITVAGPANSTEITGDIGSAPTATITGIGNVDLKGVNHAGDAVAQIAKTDLFNAYGDAAGRTHDATYAGGFDLGGMTVTSGVYQDASSLFLTGTVKLDAQGNQDAVFIFQIGSTLITASDSAVVLIGGAQANHVFWQVGSSATLGSGTDFAGNILAFTSITLNAGATVNGRVLAQNGTVTLNNNTIGVALVVETPGVPDSGNTITLLSAGLFGLLGFKRQLSRRS